VNRLIYIAHRFADDPAGNAAAMRVICAEVTAHGDIPIAPALYFPQWLDESIPDDRERGLEMACALVPLCREMRVFGDPSLGMLREINVARTHRLPVVFMEGDC
jgi:hypothetical protein